VELRQDVFLAVPRSSTYLHIGRVGQHAVTEGLQAFGRQLNGRAVGRAAIFTATAWVTGCSSQPSAALRATAKAHVLACNDPSLPVTPLARMHAA
jgi:hypothetical protein